MWKSSSWTVFKGARSLQKSCDQVISLGEDFSSRPDDQPSDSNSYIPIANSNDKYSFHDSEIAIIDALRDWSREHFSKCLVYPFDTHIPESEFGFDDEPKTVRSAKDFDVLGKVTRIKRIDDTFATVWLKDLQGTLFEVTRVDTHKFPVITAEAVLRLRSVTLSRT